MIDFNQARVVVVGGTSGAGLATALRFAAAGARVTVTGRDQSKLDKALEQQSTISGRLVDGADRSEMGKLYSSLAPIDHLVIAAGGGGIFGPFSSLGTEDFKAAFDRKFWVQITAAQAAIGRMNTAGSLTFVTGVLAMAPEAGASGIAAVNGALNAMVGPIALELAPIRVNAVAPGFLDTPYYDGMPAGKRQALVEMRTNQVPLKRAGTAEDVADAVLMLAANQFATGVVFPLDGGLLLV